MKSSRLAFFSALPLFFVVASCATAEDPSLGGVADTRPHVDASGSDTGVAGDTNPSGTDTGGRDSSSPPVDTGSAKDTGVVDDTAVDDTAVDDTFVDFDTGTTPDTTIGGSCGFCTGTCSSPFADEACFLGCVGFGGASSCNYDDSVSPASCVCVP